MSDDVAPYSEAIAEGSRAVGKALDIVKGIGRPVASAYGLVIGDQIEAWRERNLDAVTRRTQQILKERDLAETAPVAERIAIPLLEAAQQDPRPEMQEIWATLLANAMDPARRDDVRQEFIRILQALHPTDALVLKCAAEDYPDQWVTHREFTSTGLREASIAVSVRNLGMHACIDQDGESFKTFPLGIELVRACTV
jgi:hypothetical protein